MALLLWQQLCLRMYGTRRPLVAIFTVGKQEIEVYLWHNSVGSGQAGDIHSSIKCLTVSALSAGPLGCGVVPAGRFLPFIRPFQYVLLGGSKLISPTIPFSSWQWMRVLDGPQNTSHSNRGCTARQKSQQILRIWTERKLLDHGKQIELIYRQRRAAIS